MITKSSCLEQSHSESLLNASAYSICEHIANQSTDNVNVAPENDESGHGPLDGPTAGVLVNPNYIEDKIKSLLNQDEETSRSGSVHSATAERSVRKIAGLLAAEDSCNAVDHKLRGVEPAAELLEQMRGDLSFNGRIKTLTGKGGATGSNSFAVTGCEMIDATKGFERATPTQDGGSDDKKFRVDKLNESFELLTKENSSLMHYKNEQSPDLFADEDDDNEENEGDQDADVMDEHYEDDDEENRNNATDGELDVSQLVNSSLVDDNGQAPPDAIERVLFKRLQTSLCGVLPPPAKTFCQIEVGRMLMLFRENCDQFFYDGKNVEQNDEVRECLSKPTHSTPEVNALQWPEILRSKAHGLYYNKSTVSEKLESLGLKYVERYIGAETSSSFSMCRSPSSAKKRNLRLKMLNKSPGTRLSHLARRRAVFSSANLLNTSTGSVGPTGLNMSSMNKLNSFRLCNRQVLLDPKKSDNRRKSKIKTPKRHTPGRRKSPGRRKTPTSSAKKRLAFSVAAQKSNVHLPPTRETSKRALFLSPPLSKAEASQQPTENGNGGSGSSRTVKWRRSLFSPSVEDQHLEQKTGNLKRKRAEFDRPDGERFGKMPRMESINEEDLTPRSLKFARSQSFCGDSRDTCTQVVNDPMAIGGKSLFRSNSEMTFPDTNQRPLKVLTENHKKKLLWAVSQVLKSKQITVQHEQFRNYASNLLRVVKKLFLEFNDPSISSTSDKLLRLANKHVYEVIQGKSIDEIYLRERNRILSARSNAKHQGYIAPEEYEMRKLLVRSSSMATSLSDCSSLDYSFGGSQTLLSQSSIISQNADRPPSQLAQQCPPFGGSIGKRAILGESSGGGQPTGTTILRENIDSEQRQKSIQKQIFSGKDQKNVSPYSDNVPLSNKGKLLVGGTLTSIMKAKRQISFE